MSTMPSAASEKMPPRLRPMIVYAANAAISYNQASGTDPALGRRAPSASVVRGVGEAVVRVVVAGPIREWYRPSGLETLQRIEGLHQGVASQVRTGLLGRGGKNHCRGPGVLGVDVKRLELAWVVVLNRAEVLVHRRVALVVVRRQERDQRVRIAQLAVVRLLDVELVEPGAQHAWVPVGCLHGVEEAVVAEGVQ